MDKLTSILIMIIGILLILPLVNVNIPANINNWLIALAVLIIGIAKLINSFKKKI